MGTSILPYTLSREDLLGGNVAILVTVDLGGHLVRLSTEACEVESTELGMLAFAGELAGVSVPEGMDLLSQNSAGATVSIEAVFDVDVAELDAAGVPLARAPAEAALWVVGTLWEERHVLVRGWVSDPEYGAADEPVSFSIEDQPYNDAGLMPALTAQVDGSTWDTHWIGDQDVNRPYPIVIGQPGVNGQGSVTGSQAVWADSRLYYQVLVLAGHPVAASRVLINCDNDTEGVLVNVTHRPDSRGRTCAVVDYRANEYGTSSSTSYLGPDYTNQANSVFVSWQEGGLLGADGEVMRGLGDVMEWALSQGTLRVDRARFAAAKPLLNAYKIDCVIEERVQPWEWVQANLLPLAPCSIVTGPEGLYPVVWRYWATEADAEDVLDLDADPTLERAGPVVEDSGDIKNDFRLRYALSKRTDDLQLEARIGVAYDDYARVVVAGFGEDRVLLTSLYPGARGDGITLSIFDDAVATVTEDVVAKHIDFTFVDGASTTQTFILRINETSELVRAKLIAGPGTNVWHDGGADFQTADYEMVLPVASAPGSLHCQVSQARYGVLTEEAETVVVYDDATAQSVVSWKAMAKTFPRRTLPVTAGLDRARLQRGSVVVVNSSEISWRRRLCLVVDIDRDGDQVGLSLLRVENPVAEQRS